MEKEEAVKFLHRKANEKIESESMLNYAVHLARAQAYNEAAQIVQSITCGYDDMQYYMEFCKKNGYVTPQKWIEQYKHY